MLSYKMTFCIIHLLAHGLTCVCVFFVVVSLLVRKGISLFTAWGLISCRSCWLVPLTSGPKRDRQAGRQNRGYIGTSHFDVISEILQWRFEKITVLFARSCPGLSCYGCIYLKLCPCWCFPLSLTQPPSISCNNLTIYISMFCVFKSTNKST